MTREPEMVKAYRDTWELGLHSYLTYMRDRLLLARELLTPSGSIFVQISDENLHHVRELMDEVFGAENFVSLITFREDERSQTSGDLPSEQLTISFGTPRIVERLRYRQLYSERTWPTTWPVALHVGRTAGRVTKTPDPEERERPSRSADGCADLSP